MQNSRNQVELISEYIFEYGVDSQIDYHTVTERIKDEDQIITINLKMLTCFFVCVNELYLIFQLTKLNFSSPIFIIHVINKNKSIGDLDNNEF